MTFLIFSDKQSIRGTFKMADANDPDKLYAFKNGITKMNKFITWACYGFIATGVLLTITIIGAPVGIVLGLLAIYLLRRTKKSNLLIEEVYEEMLREMTHVQKVAIPVHERN